MSNNFVPLVAKVILIAMVSITAVSAFGMALG